MLVEGPIDYINYSAGTSEKKLRTNLSKAKKKKTKTNKKNWLSLHYNGVNSYLFVTEKKSITLKLIIKMPSLQTNFISETYLENWFS